jgi:hypothetical protein
MKTSILIAAPIAALVMSASAYATDTASGPASTDEAHSKIADCRGMDKDDRVACLNSSKASGKTYRYQARMREDLGPNDRRYYNDGSYVKSTNEGNSRQQ